MLTNANIEFTIRTLAAEGGVMSPAPSPEHVILSYLPLGHVAERLFTAWFNAGAGVQVNFAESIETVRQNLAEIQPTIVFGVPRIWEKVVAGIQIRTAKASPLKRLNYRLWMGVLVVLTLNSTDSAAVVGEAVAAGYEGFFIGHGPTWSIALRDSPAADALRAYFWQVGPYPTYDSDTPGHEAMREPLGEGEVRNDFHHRPGDGARSPAGARQRRLRGHAARHAGNVAGEPNDRVVRGSNIGEPDDDSSAGLVNLTTEYVGPTAEDYALTEACRDDY